MNRDFLQLYNDELRHIRERAGEFAADYPEVAGRLAMHRDGGSACPDPFVERLLEGFAFLTARVRLKLEAEYPRFTQGIMATAYPDYMAPWPSAAIVQFTPRWNDAALLKGVPIARLTTLDSRKIGESSCTYRTAHSLVLYPFRVAEAEYHLANLGTLGLKTERGQAAAFRIQLEMQGPDTTNFADVECDRLSVYLNGKGNPRLPADLMEHLFASARRILVTAPAPDDCSGSTRTWLGSSSLRHAGFAEDEALLPPSPRSFEGHRILREHFLLPQRNAFLEVNGLAAAIRKVPGRKLNLIFVLGEAKPELDGVLPPGFAQLFCTPAINLFPQPANRIPVVKGMSEYPVFINRARTLDHEVYSIESVAGYGRTSAESRLLHPFYLRPAHQEGLGGYYTVYREERPFTERDRQAGVQSTQFSRQRAFTSKDRYRGSDVYLSIANEGAPPLSPDVEELQVHALCTNRHLPLDLELGRPPGDFTARNMAQVAAVTVLAGPTPPRPSFAEGSAAWRAISHLSLNYLSLIERDVPGEKQGAETLRALLRLYAAEPGLAATQALIEGIQHVSARPGLARSPGGGPVAFIRGLEIDLTLKDAGYTGTGPFLLASVLEQFFARYVSINHYTRLTLHTSERGRVLEWPARVGNIPVC